MIFIHEWFFFCLKWHLTADVLPKRHAVTSVLTSLCLRSIRAAMHVASSRAWRRMRPSFMLVLYWAFARSVDPGRGRAHVSGDMSGCQGRSSLSSSLTGNLELGPRPPRVVNLAEVDPFVLNTQSADEEFGAWHRNANPPSRLHLLRFLPVFVVPVEPVPLHQAWWGRAVNPHLALGSHTDEAGKLADLQGPCGGTFNAAFTAHVAAGFLLPTSFDDADVPIPSWGLHYEAKQFLRSKVSTIWPLIGHRKQRQERQR